MHGNRTWLVVTLLVVGAVLVGACGAEAPAPVATEVPVTAQPPATEVPVTAQPPASDFGVAFVFPGPINDGGFNTEGYLALEHVKDMGLETAYTELVDVPDCARVAAEYAEAGYDFVWLHSGGYISCALEVAAQYPEVSFATYTTGDLTDAPDNLWRVDAKDHELFYIAGAAATLLSKTNTIGFIGGLDFPSYVAALNGYEAAAADFGTDTKVLSVFTGDFNDTVKGKEAAKGQIEGGADVIVSAADVAIFGILEAAKEAGNVWVIGFPRDQCEADPETILFSLTLDIPADVENLVTQSMAGTLGGHVILTVSTSDTVSIAYCGDNMPPDVQTKIEQLIGGHQVGEGHCS
jgi:basic membrane protein A